MMTYITDVTDTATWIAVYRAFESERQDALFRDPFAKLFIDEIGKKLARSTQGSRYTEWSVIIRTRIIDEFILNLIKENEIDLVMNLGAGLDTRPYRLNLPHSLNWIEVDFEKIINEKVEKLKSEKPSCHLKRVALDLTNQENRVNFLEKINNSYKNILILTEGVIPYLSNEDVKNLALELHQNKNFKFWITEYYSPEILEFLRTPKRLKQMRNAPFLFYPDNWFNFFQQNGWDLEETKYFGIESLRLGRTPPTPGWINKNDKTELEKIKSFLGYSVFKNSYFLK